MRAAALGAPGGAVPYGEGEAAPVEARGALAGAAGAAENDVDQEHRAPVQTGDVGVDDEPGQDRAAH